MYPSLQPFCPGQVAPALDSRKKGGIHITELRGRWLTVRNYLVSSLFSHLINLLVTHQLEIVGTEKERVLLEPLLRILSALPPLYRDL